jgi:hypothetical protein
MCYIGGLNPLTLKYALLFFLSVFAGTCVRAQPPTANSERERPLTYYLPDLDYDESIPTPEEFLGWQIGDWHISHDLLQAYLRTLAASSDRIELEVIGRSYEDRPLLNLIVTTPGNHQRLEALRQRHLNWNQPDGGLSENDIASVPAIMYQGFSIHGNEPSGGNAAPLVAYYYAAAPEEEVFPILENNIVLLDPTYNPDGFNRFASWANSHKNKNLTADGQDREYNEAYPRGRTNHYWFDLNRDWLPVQHPESRARIAQFHEWEPNILTDHHEMGTDATFFFMPGEPTRVHPMTPAVNQELTYQMGTYHARALDSIGSLYYSGEGYDDFYYGKGSTYPDINGTVGVLFEQASSRGHLQESDNGLLTFPFTIRNQVVTALSSFRALGGLRDELLRYQREFKTTQDVAGDRGYVIDATEDPSRARELARIMHLHDLPVQREANGEGVQRYFIPKTAASAAFFEPILEFEDSLFYDVSTFSMPMAFNLEYEEVNRGGGNWEAFEPTEERQLPEVGRAAYAYLLPYDDYYAPKAAYQLLDAGVRMKVSSSGFTLPDGRTSFDRGVLMIPVQNQELDAGELNDLINEVQQETGIEFHALNSGNVRRGDPMLGSRSAYETLRKPEIAILVGDGASSYDAGEVWHLLDQRFGIPVTKLPTEDVSRANLDRYNTIVMVDGRYGGLDDDFAEALKDWMGPGRVLITEKGAGTWAAEHGLASIEVRKLDRDTLTERPYEKAYRDGGGRVVGGAIFATRGDLSHPLLFGMDREEIPVFRRGTLLFEPAENAYATPLRYTDDPLMSGYSPRGFGEQAAGSAAIVVSGESGGRTISFADNPNFRGFWYGTNRLFMNAVLLGHTVSGRTVE